MSPKESPGGEARAFKELTIYRGNPGIKVPQTPRYYPKAKIRQGADRDAAPDGLTGNVASLR